MNTDARVIVAASVVTSCAIWALLSFVPHASYAAWSAPDNYQYGTTAPTTVEYTDHEYGATTPTTAEYTDDATTPNDNLECGSALITVGTVKVGDVDCNGTTNDDDEGSADLNGDGVVDLADDHTGDGVVDKTDADLHGLSEQVLNVAVQALDEGASYAQAEEEAFGAAMAAEASPEQAATVAEKETAQAMGDNVVDEARASMGVGIVQFNAPGEMRLGNSTTAEAVVVPELAEEFQRIGKEEGERRGVTIQVSSRMEATLLDFDFEVKPGGAREQAVGSAKPATWIWQVRPKDSGSPRLILQLTARIRIDDEDTANDYETFEETVAVTDPLSQRFWRFLGNNWQWFLGTVVTVALAVAGWKWSRQKEPNDRTDDGQSSEHTSS